MFVGDGWDIDGRVGDSVGEGPDVEAKVGGGPGGSRVGGRLVGDVPHADKVKSIAKRVATIIYLTEFMLASLRLRPRVPFYCCGQMKYGSVSSPPSATQPVVPSSN